MEHPSGALIAQVLPGGPAEAAGLQVGDVILSYNGTAVKSSAKLPPLVGASPVDRPAKLEVMRDGKLRSMEIVIGELPADDEPVIAASKPVPGKASRLGVTVVPLGEEQRAELQIERDAGVLVEQVEPGPAQAAGIRQGDVILKLGGDWVTSVKQFAELSADLPAKRSVAVLVQRDKGPLFLAMRLPE
jgi:serine protease Do